MRLRTRSTQSAATLPELLITAVVVGIFFAGIFEVSAVCIRYISSTKENITAIECVHDRLEQMRGTDFTSLTDATYWNTVPAVPAASPSPSPSQRRSLTVPSNPAPLASQATETVTISTFSGASATTPKVTFVRAPGAVINTSQNFSDTNLLPTTTWAGGSAFSANTSAVQVDVTYTWNAVLGGRSRTETSSTVIAAGTKK
jgi:type II secretory pathway pseudopilin PulG